MAKLLVSPGRNDQDRFAQAINKPTFEKDQSFDCYHMDSSTNAIIISPEASIKCYVYPGCAYSQIYRKVFQSFFKKISFPAIKNYYFDLLKSFV